MQIESTKRPTSALPSRQQRMEFLEKKKMQENANNQTIVEEGDNYDHVMTSQFSFDSLPPSSEKRQPQSSLKRVSTGSKAITFEDPEGPLQRADMMGVTDKANRKSEDVVMEETNSGGQESNKDEWQCNNAHMSIGKVLDALCQTDINTSGIRALAQDGRAISPIFVSLLIDLSLWIESVDAMTPDFTERCAQVNESLRTMMKQRVGALSSVSMEMLLGLCTCFCCIIGKKNYEITCQQLCVSLNQVEFQIH
ncbi:hypothetical protein RFI_02188 [Reticulomyxa filosa]|uniref:Uncharacterized protein n=1 Tax=Reticulomyxa filosa TaxID=46433 RepID=X6P8R5_RETFI|nr:hypothetical protein RFI_02188 [Reticulomyxa filosa]|eukprot:ETO34905.1 hypothetical protein RFI_02188 [Reticulomyxa filosa]